MSEPLPHYDDYKLAHPAEYDDNIRECVDCGDKHDIDDMDENLRCEACASAYWAALPDNEEDAT